MKAALLLFFLLITSFVTANPAFFPTFTPPQGWLIADPSKLEESVQVGFVESTKRLFSPSITLTLEPIGNIDLKTYLEAVKKHYHADRTNRYRELGIINTSLGKTPLLQIDMENQWGKIRVLQAISLHADYAVIQTAVCLQKDFLKVHETFLNTFKSITVYPSLFDSIDNAPFQSKVETLYGSWKKYVATAKDDTKTLFTSPFFQNNQWTPFVNFVEKELANQGPCWQFLALRHIKESLLENVK